MKQFLLFTLLFFAPLAVAAQDTVTITIEDLRSFRKAGVDRDFWQAAAKDKDDQLAAANKSAADWKTLYLAEKDRADRVQEKRATEATAAATDFQKANVELRDQNTDLKREKRELEDKLTGAKAQRKWYFATGGIAGGFLGFFGGRQTCGLSIPGLRQCTLVYTHAADIHARST
jgi:hypothetical protein